MVLAASGNLDQDRFVALAEERHGTAELALDGCPVRPVAHDDRRERRVYGDVEPLPER